MLQSKYVSKIGQKSIILFFCVFNVFSCITTIFAQTQEWIYIARSPEGRYFVKRKIDQINGNNRAIWMKILSDDGSEQVSYSEWDCRGSRFRLNQTSVYAPDGTALEHYKKLDWAKVAPETVSETLFEEACGTPSDIKFAVIILKEVKLRAAPTMNAEVIRTVKQNEVFPLTPFAPIGAWYQIYDPNTLAEYWVHGNGIKIKGEVKRKIKSGSNNKSKKEKATGK